MKCAILLLVFCSFETVFAKNQYKQPYEAQLDNLHKKYTDEMRVILSDFETFATDLAVKTQSRNTHVGNCLAEYRELEKYYEAELIKCNVCYRNAQGHGYLKVAERCYIRHVINLNTDAAKRNQEVRYCIFSIVNGLPDWYTMRPAPIARASTPNKSKSEKFNLMHTNF